MFLLTFGSERARQGERRYTAYATYPITPHTGASRNGGIGGSIGKSIQKDKEMSNFKWQIANMGQAERQLWDGQETDPQGQEIGLRN